MGLSARAIIMAYIDSDRVRAAVIVVCDPIRKKLSSLSIEEIHGWEKIQRHHER